MDRGNRGLFDSLCIAVDIFIYLYFPFHLFLFGAHQFMALSKVNSRQTCANFHMEWIFGTLAYLESISL